jgi:eukaryotic-like serine/threonine-protein kinase
VRSGDTIASRFVLAEFLGRGGFGEVWAATDQSSGVRRAVKLLVGPALAREENRARFLAEARIANAFVHPNLVQVFDVLQAEDGTLAIVMELLVGTTLGARLESGAPLRLRDVAGLLGPIVGATMAVHERGIVHRDIKPDNIFLAQTPWGLMMPKLLDFGIAKLVVVEGGPVTSTGATIGTPCYMAPEQAFGEPSVDARADVFSLGVVLYECLAGFRPIEATNLGQYVKSLASSAIVPLPELRSDLSPELTGLVMRMLSLDKSQRPGLHAVLGVLTSDDATTSPSAVPSTPPAVEAQPPEPTAQLDDTLAAPTRRFGSKEAAPVVSQRGDSRRWYVGGLLAVVLGVMTAWLALRFDVGTILVGP